jgi:hypothetical protein
MFSDIVINLGEFIIKYIGSIQDFLINTENKKVLKVLQPFNSFTVYIDNNEWNYYTHPFSYTKNGNIEECVNNLYKLEEFSKNNINKNEERIILLMRYLNLTEYICKQFYTVFYTNTYTNEDLKMIDDKKLRIFFAILRAFMYLIQHNVEFVLFHDDERKWINFSLIKLTVFHMKALFDFRKLMLTNVLDTHVANQQQSSYSASSINMVKLLEQLTNYSKIPDDKRSILTEMYNKKDYDNMTNLLINILEQNVNINVIDDISNECEKQFDKYSNEIQNDLIELKQEMESLLTAFEKKQQNETNEIQESMIHTFNRYKSSTTQLLNEALIEEIPHYNDEICSTLLPTVKSINQNQLAILQQREYLRIEAMRIKEDLLGSVRIFVKIRGVSESNKGDPVCYHVGNVGKQGALYDNQGKTAPHLCELTQSGGKCLERNEEHTDKYLQVSNLNRYERFFDVFHSNQTNEDVFCSMKSMFDQILQGDTVAIFGYGYSGSGKTYTLLNIDDNEINNGVLLHSIKFFLENNAKIEVSSIHEFYVDKINLQSNYSQIIGKLIVMYGRNDIKSLKSSINISVKIHDQHDEISKTIQQFNETSILSEKIQLLKEILDIVKKNRVLTRTIKATINNPESSRSHLFLKFKVTTEQGKHGSLVICDMAGREDPLEIFYNSYVELNGTHFIMFPYKQETQETQETITKRTSSLLSGSFDTNKRNTQKTHGLNATLEREEQNKIFSVDFASIFRNYEKQKENEEYSYKSWIKSVVSNENKILKKSIKEFIKGPLKIKQSKDTDNIEKAKKAINDISNILETVYEGFYINETINHIMYFFKIKNGVIPSSENFHIRPFTKKGAKALPIDPQKIQPEESAYKVNEFFKDPSHESKTSQEKIIPEFNKISNISEIGIIPYLENVIGMENTKYVMIACIRSENEKKFTDFNEKTLEFAKSISSANFN